MGGLSTVWYLFQVKQEGPEHGPSCEPSQGPCSARRWGHRGSEESGGSWGHTATQAAEPAWGPAWRPGDLLRGSWDGSLHRTVEIRGGRRGSYGAQQLLWQLPVAALTTTNLVARLTAPEVGSPNIQVSAGLRSFWRLRQSLFCAVFSFQRPSAPLGSWPPVPSSEPVSAPALRFCHHVSLCLPLTRTSAVTLGPPGTRDAPWLLLTFGSDPLPCQVTYSQVPGSRP